MTKHEIFCTDSSNLGFIEEESVHLIVTSPPYPMIEMWDGVFAGQDVSIEQDLHNGDGYAAFNKMHDYLNLIWTECDRVLVNNGFICINIGDAVRTLNNKFQMYSNHTKIIEFFSKRGYSILPDILWKKPSNSPNKFMGSGMYPAGAYVTYEHEYILVFRKGSKRTFNESERRKRQESAYFWEERNVWFSDIWEIKGTSQTMDETSARKRNASFPIEIPYRLINMYSIKGDTVLDPFCGLGTTNLAALASERNSIGIEISSEIAELARCRLSESKDMLNAIISSRLSAHMNFISSLGEEKRNRCYQNTIHDFPVKTKQEILTNLQHIDSIAYESGSIVCKYE